MPRIEHIFDADDGTEGKWCGKCKQYIDVTNFCKAKTWDGLRSTCNDCLHADRVANKAKITEYNKKNWQKTMARQKETNKKWRSENKEYIAEKHKEWRAVNGKEFDKKTWQKRKNDPEYKAKYNAYRREYDKMKRKTDPCFKIKTNFMRRLREVIHSGGRALHTSELLGCTVEKFKEHLESQFDEKMSWENYSNTGWHIDHIVPCAYFDLTRKSHQRRCFHYINMQPMWSTENITKSDTLTEQGEYTWLELHTMFPEEPDELDLITVEDLIEESEQEEKEESDTQEDEQSQEEQSQEEKEENLIPA